MKKGLSLFLICLLFVSTTGFAFADTETTDPYEAVVEKYNALYDVDLIYEEVNSEKISVAEYDEMVQVLAASERETLDYIESREKDVYVPSFEQPGITTNATTTKISNGKKTAYSVGGSTSPLSKSAYTVEYTYYSKYDASHSPTKWVVKKSGEKPTVTVSKTLGSVNSFSRTSFSTKYLDNQKTIGVTTKGTLKMYTTDVGLLSFSGVTVYAEFSYK